MLTKKLHDEMELVARHIKVLEIVKDNQPIGIVRISQLTGLNEHEVRHSLSVLEDEGLIKPTPKGAVINEDIKEYLLKLGEELEEVSNVAKVLKREVIKML